MSEIDNWRKRIRQESISSDEEINAYMMSKVSSDKPFRLEILKEEDSDFVLIQGNLAGLNSLKEILARLINTNTIGGHTHLESGHGLTKANVSVVIQLVDDEGNDGSHAIK